MQYLDYDSFVFSLKTESVFKDAKNLEKMFDFGNLMKNQELLSNNNKKLGKFKKEIPKINWIDEFIVLRNKMYAFKRGDAIKFKLKSFCKSQPRSFMF